jgi:HTH-type transcriptional regulator/antitoxin HigA
MGSIRDEAHYDRLVELMNSLLDAGAGEASHPLAGLLYVLGEAIYAWDQTHYPLPPADPEGMLTFLMEQHGLVPADLSELGGQEAVSEILADQRRLEPRQIKILAQRFGVGAAVFVD